MDTGRVDDALGLLDQATPVALSIPASEPQRENFSMILYEQYISIGKLLARDGDSANSKRVLGGISQLLKFFESQQSDRPDLVLFKACVLADHGEWDRARRMVHTLLTGKGLGQAEHMLVRDGEKAALAAWFERVRRHGDSSNARHSVESEAFRREVDVILGFATDPRAALGIKQWAGGGTIKAIADGFAAGG